MALAIELEQMQEIKLNQEEYLLSFETNATTLTFNFGDSAIVSSHPIRVTFLTSLPNGRDKGGESGWLKLCFLAIQLKISSRESQRYVL